MGGGGGAVASLSPPSRAARARSSMAASSACFLLIMPGGGERETAGLRGSAHEGESERAAQEVRAASVSSHGLRRMVRRSGEEEDSQSDSSRQHTLLEKRKRTRLRLPTLSHDKRSHDSECGDYMIRT